MIIHPVILTHEKGQVRVAAQIEPEQPPYNVPQTLWFRFPEAQAHLISDRADGFAVALLYSAAIRGENLHVRGALSPQLAYGLQEDQHVLHLRQPKLFHEIRITADQYSPAAFGGSKTAASFSGGVDSFYTLSSHLPQKDQNAGNELDYALFVQGFDIGLEDHANFEKCRAAYAALLPRVGVELLTVQTNARAFDRADAWGITFDAPLIGIGHILGRGLARFYSPSNHAYADFPRGTLPALQDWLLSSESVRVTGDGARMTKFQKTVALSQVPITYDYLRVCYTKPNGVINCCECSKCLNVMTALELAGALNKYSTFPKPLDRRRLRTSHVQYAALGIHASTLQGALEQHRYDIAFDLSVKFLLNYFRWGKKWFRTRLLR